MFGKLFSNNVRIYDWGQLPTLVIDQSAECYENSKPQKKVVEYIFRDFIESGYKVVIGFYESRHSMSTWYVALYSKRLNRFLTKKEMAEIPVSFNSLIWQGIASYKQEQKIKFERRGKKVNRAQLKRFERSFDNNLFQRVLLRIAKG
jgi:hypothetical protein